MAATKEVELIGVFELWNILIRKKEYIIIILSLGLTFKVRIKHIISKQNVPLVI